MQNSECRSEGKEFHRKGAKGAKSKEEGKEKRFIHKTTRKDTKKGEEKQRKRRVLDTIDRI